MKIRFVFFLAIVTMLSTACSKKVNTTSGNNNPAPVDSTITDTTQFIDFELDGHRIFQISSTTADSNSNWSWYPLIGFWGTAFPDTIHYQYSSLKGALINTNSTATPGFYFLKNSLGLNFEDYIAHKEWWTPLILKTFIDSFFAAGDYEYAISTGRDTTFTPTGLQYSLTRNLLTSGMQLTWIDSTGKKWQTSNGTANQTGSYFTITENTSTPFTFQPGYSEYAEGTIVTASFQCNLYDAAGNALHLTNGRFRLALNFELDAY